MSQELAASPDRYESPHSRMFDLDNPPLTQHPRRMAERQAESRSGGHRSQDRADSRSSGHRSQAPPGRDEVPPFSQSGRILGMLQTIANRLTHLEGYVGNANTAPHVSHPPTDPRRNLFQTPARPTSVDVEDRMARLEQALHDSAAYNSMAPWEASILRQITDLPPFTGEDSTTWKDYEASFVSKASLLKSLPPAHWVPLLHAHVQRSALAFAVSKGLVVGVNLRDCTFEQYCATMRSSMFGEALTITGTFNALLSVTQTGHFADYHLFLREKERYLIQIPSEELGPRLRAACTLIGMEPTL